MADFLGLLDHLLKVLSQVFIVIDGDDDGNHLGSCCLKPFHIAVVRIKVG